MRGTVSAVACRWLLAAAAAGVCLAQAPSLKPQPASPQTPAGANSSPAAARVIALTGQVSVLRDSIPWALEVGDQVFPRQVIVTGPDGFARFQLADGSTFEVYPNSRAVFRNNPGDWRHLVEVWLGRLKFRIQRLNGLPNPNRVDTPTAVISVRGTIFDVEVDDDQESTLVVVDEGQVAVQHKLLPRGEPRLLNAGEWIRVYKSQPLAQKMVDKGSVLRRALQAIADALYTAVYDTPGSTGAPRGPTPPAGGSPGGGLPGDTGPSTPPPPPPPPDVGEGPPPPP
jgi:ferric-dicitrate binding protein FerR (iron transport regulator)